MEVFWKIPFVAVPEPTIEISSKNFHLVQMLPKTLTFPASKYPFSDLCIPVELEYFVLFLTNNFYYKILWKAIYVCYLLETAVEWYMFKLINRSFCNDYQIDHPIINRSGFTVNNKLVRICRYDLKNETKLSFVYLYKFWDVWIICNKTYQNICTKQLNIFLWKLTNNYNLQTI